MGSAVQFAGAVSLGSTFSVEDTTQSTSVSTGCAVLAGGLGVAKNAYVGGSLNVSGQVNLSGNVLMSKANANIRIDATSGAASLFLDRLAGNASSVLFRTETENRWGLLVTSDAEGGGDTGSNFSLGRYDNDGAWLDAPLSVARGTGLVTLKAATVTGKLTSSGARARKVSARSTNGTLDPATDHVVICSGSMTTLTMPDSGDCVSGQEFQVMNTTSGSVTINRSGTDTFSGGGTSYSLASRNTAIFVLYGGMWRLMAEAVY